MEPEQEVLKVTSGKAKSPGRVEWGRKLAALAKAHKEEKRAAALKVPEPEHEPEPDHPKGSKSYLPWLAFGSLVIGLAALYYQRRAVIKAEQKCEGPIEITPPVKPKPKIIGMQ